MILEQPVLKKINTIPNAKGQIGVLEGSTDFKFVPHRFYFISEVPENESRGFHAHKKLKQFFVALSGSFKIALEGPAGKFEFVLNSKEQGLYLPAGYWRILSEFSKDSICGVFASSEFDEDDYIRDYEEFKKTLNLPKKVAYVNFDRMLNSQQHVYEKDIHDVLNSHNYILGPYVAEFEKNFSQMIGSEFSLGVASGLDALVLILRAWGVGEGDEVIIPANTFYASALAVSMVGAKPVFIDADPENYNADPTFIEAAITPRTKVISVTHLYGNPCDMDPVMAIAKKHNLLVLEDAAQAHGARYKDRKCGNIGHAAAFSFYPTKNLGAFGDGGLVTTNDPKLFEKIRLLRNYGASKKYFYSELGYNSRLDEIHAKVLNSKLNSLDEWNQKRINLAKIYSEGLKGIESLKVPSPTIDSESVWHVYCLQVLDGSRDRLIEFLEKSNVATNIHYPLPIHLQEAYASLGYKRGDFPISEKLSNQAISLPLDQYHSEDEIRFVVQKIREFYHG